LTVVPPPPVVPPVEVYVKVAVAVAGATEVLVPYEAVTV